MLKLIWTLWILSFSLIILNAQVPNINWNAPLIKKELRKARHNFLGSTQEHYYFWDRTKSENAIVQFALNHKRVNSIPVNTLKGEKKEYRKIVNTASGDYIIATDYRKKQLSFYTSRIHPDGRTDVENKLAFTSNTKNVEPFHKARQSGLYFDFTSRVMRDDQVGVFLSQDRTKVVYANTQKQQHKNMEVGVEKYHIVVLNEDLEKLWEREINFQTKKNKINIRQVAVTNSGEVYILALTAKGNAKLSFGLLLGTDITPRYNVVVYKINKANELEPQVIKIDGVHPTHSRLSINENGGFLVTGFFTQESAKKFLREHGVYFTKYDNNGNQLMQKTHHWEDSFYEQLKEKKVKKAKSPLITNNLYTFRIGNIFIEPTSQSISFVADYIYSQQIEKRSDTRSMHLIIPYFNLKGEYLRTICIEKKDIRSYKGQAAKMDYFSLQKDGMLIFIFYDNKSSKELRKMPNFKRKQMAKFIEMAQVDSNGEVIFQDIIYNTAEVEGQLHFSNTRYLGDGQILIDGGGWRQRRVGILKLP